jgi:hypothetical protein
MHRLNGLRLLLAAMSVFLAGVCPAKADEAAPGKFPKIVLIRHAEKPPNFRVADGGSPDLNEAGYARAKKLVDYLQKTYGKADFVFAAGGKKSKRPEETITPYAKAIGVPVDLSFDDIQYEKLADKLLSDPKYAGKLVVVCWRHEDMPQFGKCLHAPDGILPKVWNTKIFDLYFVFDYPDKATDPKVTPMHEPF